MRGSSSATPWPTGAAMTPSSSAAARPVATWSRASCRRPAPTAWLPSTFTPRSRPSAKQTSVNAAWPPRPPPASAAGPRRPTKSVSTSVITLYESVETAMGQLRRKSSAEGCGSQGRAAGAWGGTRFDMTTRAGFGAEPRRKAGGGRANEARGKGEARREARQGRRHSTTRWERPGPAGGAPATARAPCGLIRGDARVASAEAQAARRGRTKDPPRTCARSTHACSCAARIGEQSGLVQALIMGRSFEESSMCWSRGRTSRPVLANGLRAVSIVALAVRPGRRQKRGCDVGAAARRSDWGAEATGAGNGDGRHAR